jgi:hypothetical protein
MILLRKCYLEITLVERETTLYGREKVTYSSTFFGHITSEETKNNAENMALVFRPPSMLLEISAILLHQARDL